MTFLPEAKKKKTWKICRTVVPLIPLEQPIWKEKYSPITWRLGSGKWRVLFFAIWKMENVNAKKKKRRAKHLDRMDAVEFLYVQQCEYKWHASKHTNIQRDRRVVLQRGIIGCSCCFGRKGLWALGISPIEWWPIVSWPSRLVAALDGVFWHRVDALGRRCPVSWSHSPAHTARSPVYINMFCFILEKSGCCATLGDVTCVILSLLPSHVSRSS